MNMDSYLFIDGHYFWTLWKGLATRILGGPPPLLALDALKRGFGKAFYYDALPDEDTIQAAQNKEKKEELITTRNEKEELFREIRRLFAERRQARPLLPREREENDAPRWG